MPDIEGARLILAAARRDLHALENMMNPHAFPGEIFGFHAQQAVEKALKGWLALLATGWKDSRSGADGWSSKQGLR